MDSSRGIRRKRVESAHHAHTVAAAAAAAAAATTTAATSPTQQAPGKDPVTKQEKNRACDADLWLETSTSVVERKKRPLYGA